MFQDAFGYCFLQHRAFRQDSCLGFQLLVALGEDAGAALEDRRLGVVEARVEDLAKRDPPDSLDFLSRAVAACRFSIHERHQPHPLCPKARRAANSATHLCCDVVRGGESIFLDGRHERILGECLAPRNVRLLVRCVPPSRHRKELSTGAPRIVPTFGRTELTVLQPAAMTAQFERVDAGGAKEGAGVDPPPRSSLAVGL